MPFRELVPQVTDGKRVLPLDEHSQPLIDAILQAAESTVAFLNGPNSPARQQRRINEVSRFAEEHLRSALGAIPDIVCTIPTNAQGKQVRSGYPDLIVTHTENAP